MKREGRNTEINWVCLPWGVYSLPEEIRNNCKVFEKSVSEKNGEYWKTTLTLSWGL